MGHFSLDALLEVAFPCRVIRIGLRFHFDVALDRDTGCLIEIDNFLVSVFVLDFGMEAPLLSEVAVSDPVGASVAVSPFRPTAKRLKDNMVDFLESVLATHVAMVVDPSPDKRVQLLDQVPGGCSGVFGDDGSHLTQYFFDTLFGRRNQEFAFVLADILSQEVESFFKISNPGFLWRDFQTTRLQEFFNSWGDVFFE